VTDKEWQQIVADRLERIEEGIFGNGKPGLRREVDRLNWLASMGVWMAVTVGTSLVVGACGVAWLLVKQVI
jgi:hypothetical protein